MQESGLEEKVVRRSKVTYDYMRTGMMLIVFHSRITKLMKDSQVDHDDSLWGTLEDSKSISISNPWVNPSEVILSVIVFISAKDLSASLKNPLVP